MAEENVIRRHQVTTQDHSSDDNHMFEDGLVHLRKLYEAQLASSRSNTLYLSLLSINQSINLFVEKKFHINMTAIM